VNDIEFPAYKTVKMSLADIGNGTGEQPVEIVATPLGVSIYAQGFGDNWSVEGRGIPVWIDFRNGDLRVYVWANINSENPTHVISLANAREDCRIEPVRQMAQIRGASNG
jgi:hypothetical protein